jgi:hypothetical protein
VRQPGFNNPADTRRNNANDYDPRLIGSGGALTANVRDIHTIETAFNPARFTADIIKIKEFDAILENARN